MDQFKKITEKTEEIKPAITTRTTSITCDPLVLRKNKVMFECDRETVTDQFKILRTQVMNRMKKIGANTLLVTSANACEGKTFTAINLAVGLSSVLDYTVLLVDTDLRSPSIHDYIGLDTGRGLSDYLLKKMEIPDLLIKPGIGKLVILPSGKPLPNSAEFLGGSEMEDLIHEMKKRYSDRFIIFDSSSLLTSADPLELSRFVDCVLLVVEAEKTTAAHLKRALDLLEGRTIIGIVINKDKA